MGLAYRKFHEQHEHQCTTNRLHKYFSEEELATLHACFFERFNGCEITESAFIRFYHEIYADSLRNPLVTHLLRRIECKKPGMIHFEDFLNAFGIVRRGSVEERKEWIFSLYAENNNADLADKLELLELIRTVYRVSYTIHDGSDDKFELASVAEERMRSAFFSDHTVDRLISKQAFKQAWVNNEDIWQITVETIALLLQDLFDGMRKTSAATMHTSPTASTAPAL